MLLWLIRYWYVWIAGILSLVYFWILETVSTVFIVTGVSVLYVFLLLVGYAIVYWRSMYRMTVLITILTTVIGSVGVFLLMEVASLRMGLLLFLSIVIGAVYYIPQRFTAYLAHEYKPWRRMFVSIMTFSLFSLLVTLYGVHMFFQAPHIILYALFGAGVSGLLSYAIFRLYYTVHSQAMLVWSLLIGGVSGELIIAIAYLPLGYLWLALLTILIWYSMVTLVRFHLSPKRIQWHKQRTFLIGVIVFLFLLLFWARWV